MNKVILIALFVFIFKCFFFIRTAIAIENPIAVPNNKFGVHILFPEELGEAASLINSTGGDWGYVTIPIQASDKDIDKWQKFMDAARENHIIPIIRIAAEGDYFNSSVWRKPTYVDIIDFANFLDSLEWPTKNHYIVIFNEVNRSDEWGDDVNPEEYAKLLQYSVNVFKSKSKDFFIISAGLDNAAPNKSAQFMDQYDFILAMNKAIPGIFDQIDGFASHSYPNPGFSQPPEVDTAKSVHSFKYERALIQTMANKRLPIFITETGWSQKIVPESKVALYFEETFMSVWNDEDIIAITPFLLRGGEPFVEFSLINPYGSSSLIYNSLQKIPKIEGKPVLLEKNQIKKSGSSYNILSTKNFTNDAPVEKEEVIKIKSELNAIKSLIKWLIKT